MAKVKVEFISKTEHPTMTSEQLIVYLARVSNPSNQNNIETSEKLIKYLIENKHWSPFEMVDYTFEIETSRAIGEQMIRHNSFRFQIWSQRYSEVFAFENIELRQQAETNRQSSTKLIADFGLRNAVETFLQQAGTLYQTLLENGVAKECARFIMPLATTTRMYMKGNLRSWLHYLNIRLEHHTQKEHRLIAEEIAKYFLNEVSTIAKSLNNFNNLEGNFIA